MTQPGLMTKRIQRQDLRHRKLMRELPLHLMLLAAVVIVVIFCYVPILGLVMGFQRFIPTRGFLHSPWVGLGNFRYLINLPGTFQVLFNTVFIATMKIVAGIIVPVAVSLMLNEVRCTSFKRTV